MGIACLWIIAYHNFCDWPRALRPLKWFVNRGNAGVDVFLILSGIGLYYSFSGSKEEKGKVRQFYKRRFVRLLIPYILFALPYYMWAANGHGINRFLMDFFQISLPLKGMVTTWYITASAVFYLLFPLIYVILEKQWTFKGKPIERNTVTVILCVLAALMCRIILRFWPVFFKNCEIALTRLVPFLAGCGLGKAVKEGREISKTMVFSSFVFVFVYVCIFMREIILPTFWARMSFTPFALSVLVVFSWIFEQFELAKLRSMFRFFGDRSLELYLTHVMIKRVWLTCLKDVTIDPWSFTPYLCVVILSVIISTLTHPLIQTISSRILTTK